MLLPWQCGQIHAAFTFPSPSFHLWRYPLVSHKIWTLLWWHWYVIDSTLCSNGSNGAQNHPEINPYAFAFFVFCVNCKFQKLLGELVPFHNAKATYDQKENRFGRCSSQRQMGKKPHLTDISTKHTLLLPAGKSVFWCQQVSFTQGYFTQFPQDLGSSHQLSCFTC